MTQRPQHVLDSGYVTVYTGPGAYLLYISFLCTVLLQQCHPLRLSIHPCSQPAWISLFTRCPEFFD